VNAPPESSWPNHWQYIEIHYVPGGDDGFFYAPVMLRAISRVEAQMLEAEDA
jgi:hypothetical protein